MKIHNEAEYLAAKAEHKALMAKCQELAVQIDDPDMPKKLLPLIYKAEDYGEALECYAHRFHRCF